MIIRVNSPKSPKSTIIHLQEENHFYQNTIQKSTIENDTVIKRLKNSNLFAMNAIRYFYPDINWKNIIVYTLENSHLFAVSAMKYSARNIDLINIVASIPVSNHLLVMNAKEFLAQSISLTNIFVGESPLFVMNVGKDLLKKRN